MIIKYTFCNETVEIEVAEKWGAIILDLDRGEYNNNQMETRRHCSLDALDKTGDNIPSDLDVEADFIKKEEYALLYYALLKLPFSQQEIIREHYFEGKKSTDLASEEGVDVDVIRHRLWRAIKNLKKILKKRVMFCHFRDLIIEGFFPLSTLTTEYTTIQHDPVDHAKCENHSMLHATIHNWGAKMRPTNVGWDPP